MKRTSVWLLFAVGMLVAACQRIQPEDVILYADRSQSVVSPLIRDFVQSTDISVSVQHGDADVLASTLTAAGDDGDVDLFWTEDVRDLSPLQEDSLLAVLPDSLLEKVPDAFRAEDGTWIAPSLRARTLAYAGRTDTVPLPESIFALADTAYAGRVGWVPQDAAFQYLIGALQHTVGRDSTRSWLQSMQERGAVSYPDDGAVLEAIARGEVDYGLVAREALSRRTAQPDTATIQHTFFADGDPGNLVFLSGLALLRNADQRERALRLISYLLSQEGQRQLTNVAFEHPTVPGAASDTILPLPDRIGPVSTGLQQDSLPPLSEPQSLLRQVGLL